MSGRLQATQAARRPSWPMPAQARAWHGALAGLLDAPTVPGMVQGRACRLLLDAERLEADEAGGRLARARHARHPGRPTGRPSSRASWPAAAPCSCTTAPCSACSTTGWPASPRTAFTDTLPLLRRTFATFEPSERRLIGELVRRGSAGPRHRPPVDRRSTRSAPTAALATMAELLGVDREQAR